MAVRNSAYDILLNGQGYMLARKNQLTQGGRSWSVESAGFSTTQQSADERRYGTAPPTVEATMVWRTTHMGYGEERQRIEGAYNYTINADARFYEQVIPGPKVYTIDIENHTTNIKGFAEFNGALYANNGRYINAIATTGLVTSKDLADFAVGQSATDMETFDDHLLVACGLTKPMASLNTSGVWDESPGDETGATTVYATHLTKWTDYLYGSVATGYQVAMVASGADPLNYENWSGLSTIGDQTTSITSLAASHVLVYVGKQDGLHALDASAVSPPLTPELREYISDDNCANMLAWHGSMWVPHLRGLLAYKDLGDSGFSLRSVGPGRNLTSSNPIRGSITAMAGDDNWLYAALYTGTDTYILAGREYTFSEGQTAMLWHPLIKLANAKCEAMILSGLWDSPRLFFGINQDAGYIILPKNSDNPLQDSACRYSATGSIYYSAHSWNAPSTTKMWKSIEIQADNLGRMQYVTVYYRVDKGAWVELGDAKVSPSTSLGITPSGVSGEEIEIRLDFVQLSEQTPIIVHGVIARGIERPETTDIISAVVRCADKLPLRTTGYCPRTGATILSELKALAYYPTSVTLVDPIGAERQVVVIPPVTEQAEYAQTGEMSRELLINLQMAVVEFEESRFTEITVFGGGSGTALLVPVMVPITLGGEEMSASVTFTSTKTSRPRITIIGSFAADLVITNTTTGHVLDFTGTVIGTTKIITIDMHTTVPTVTDEAGADWSGYLVSSDLNSFVVTTGSNTITATATGVVAASRIYLEY